MTATHPIAAIVLAAGKSTRMGQPKQLLPYGSTTLLNQTLRNLRAAGLEQIVLVLGANADAIQTTLPPEPLTVAHNPRYEQGMATSLHAGLAALAPATEAALIVLADQPSIRPHTFRQLAGHPLSGSILIPTFHGKRGNPVRIPRALFPRVMQLGGDTGCRALFPHHPVELLDLEDESILNDLDTPEDYRRHLRDRR